MKAMMHIRAGLITCWSALFASMALGALDGMYVNSTVTSARYCSGPKGAITLRLKVAFTYRNTGDTAVALPRFSRLSGYSIFRNEDDLRANRAVVRTSFQLRDIFETLKADTANPSALLFESVLPGEVTGRVDEVSIPLSGSKEGEASLFGTAPLIKFTLDNWPGHQHIQAVRHVWARLGSLWASEDTTPAVRLNIEATPSTEPCVPRVD
jgi:hypothetical protein